MYHVVGGITSRAFRVIWMLEELGQDFTVDDVKPHSDPALAANTTGKIPALRVGDDYLTDSSAILSYLADKHQTLTHTPGTVERARQDALMHRILDELEALLWTAAVDFR